MINEAMKELGNKRSIIREIFEYSKQREKIVGKENVFNFSIGNPSVPAPEIVNKTIADLALNFSSIELHGYTSAQGDEEVRAAISQYIKTQYGATISPSHIYMTTGAAAGLAISFKALCVEEDEMIIFAPYFPEYRVFASVNGIKTVAVKPLANLQPDLEDFKAKINAKTKAFMTKA